MRFVKLQIAPATNHDFQEYRQFYLESDQGKYPNKRHEAGKIPFIT
jgi:hypothetical protein